MIFVLSPVENYFFTLNLPSLFFHVSYLEEMEVFRKYKKYGNYQKEGE